MLDSGSHELSALHLVVYRCQCYSPSSFHLPFPRCVHMSILYICIYSCPATQETVFWLKTGRPRQKQLYTNTTLQLGTWFLLVNAGYQLWNCVPCQLGWTSKSVDGGWLEPIFPLLERECLKKQGNQARMKPVVLHWSWWHCYELSWARDRYGWMHLELIPDLCVSRSVYLQSAYFIYLIFLLLVDLFPLLLRYQT